MKNVTERNLQGVAFPHSGRLLEHVMKKHDLTRKRVDALTGIGLKMQSRIFAHDDCTRETEQAIINIIAEEGRPGLSPRRRRQLVNIVNHSRGQLREGLEAELSVIDLSHLQDRGRSSELESLVTQLELETSPAFIMDELWFVHAYNGACFELFGVDYRGRDEDKLRHWQTWHVIGTKFAANSIVREAHITPHRYFKPAVDQFFQDVHLYLFTVQVKALTGRIWEVAGSQFSDFEAMWRNAIGFRGEEYPVEHLTRTLRNPENHNRKLEVRFVPVFTRSVTIVPDTRGSTTYKLVKWDARDGSGETSRFLRELGQRNRDILFAADYEDENNRFHVNSWQETRDRLSEIDVI